MAGGPGCAQQRAPHPGRAEALNPVLLGESPPSRVQDHENGAGFLPDARGCPKQLWPRGGCRQAGQPWQTGSGTHGGPWMLGG